MHTIYSDESKHSEMYPVRQNSVQKTVRSIHMCVCIALCTIVALAHNIAQNRPDNFPSYSAVGDWMSTIPPHMMWP